MRVAGYVRVSSREQEASGLSLAAQKDALSAAAALRDGWTLAHISVEIASAGNIRGRPVLRNLLADLDKGKFDGLIVTRLDRLARSVADFADMLDRAKRHGWTLVCLDPAVDMSTPYGEAMAGVAAVFAQLERSLISWRTREGLAVARARGTFRPGEAGRFDDHATITRMHRWRAQNVSYGEIARRLSEEGVRTARGGQWAATVVRDIIIRTEGK